MTRNLVALALAVWCFPTVGAAAEPDEVGPLAVTSDAYDFGDQVFEPLLLGHPAELAAAVYSPADLSGGPFPLIMMMHGRHATCYNPANPGGTPGDGSFGGGFLEWPCSGPRVTIPSYDGYAFLGEMLASHGFIVVSVSANAVNAFDEETEDSGMTARADVFSEHLALWAEWNEAGGDPFGGRFTGAVDFDRIGMMGHSRGGEGVAKWIALDQADGEPNFIDAALLIAPVDFQRLVLGQVPLAVVLPYCDGDVANLEGAHYVDDARDAAPNDDAPKYAFLMDGSNHNFYNTIWSPGEFTAGAADDFTGLEEFLGPDPYCGSQSAARLTEAEQRSSLLPYALAFFRAHLNAETEFDEVLTGDVVPASASVASPAVTYLGPDTVTERLDVNTLETEASLSINDLGEAVEASALPRYGLCGLLDNAQFVNHCVDAPGFIQGQAFDGREPNTPGLGQLRVEFSTGGVWTNRLPAQTDVSRLSVLQFRIALDFESPLAQADPNLRIGLGDASGAMAVTSIRDHSRTFAAPQGSLYPILPKKVLRTVRVPLTAFEGIDLTAVSDLTISLDRGSAALLLSDLAFSDALPEEPDSTGSSSGSETTSDASEDSSTSTSSGGTAMSDSSSGPASTTMSGDASTGGGDTGTDTDTAPSDSSDSGCGCQSSFPRKSFGLGLCFVLAFLRRRGKR